MRMWHKDLIDVLPKNQLVAQWRECCAIAANLKTMGTPNHLLVNKVTWFNKSHFYNYCCLVCEEMLNRGYNVSDKSKQKILDYVDEDERQTGIYIDHDKLFQGWHGKRYLLQCYFNLQEKFDCNGITIEEWKKINSKVKMLLDEENLKL